MSGAAAADPAAAAASGAPEEISDATSKRICTHMTDDHKSSLTGMVIQSVGSSQGNVKDVRMTKITLKGCELSYAVCTSNDVCDMKTVFYEFNPPLESAKDARKRLVDIHHEVLAPKLSWLYADIRSITVILVLGSLAYLIYGLTVEGAIEWIETGAPRMDKAVTLLFGSAETLMGVLRGMWYFSVAAHLAESSYVSYHAIKTLRIRPTQVVLWSIYVLLAGISVTKRFLPLLEAQVASQKKNK